MPVVQEDNGQEDAASDTSMHSAAERHPIPDGMRLSTKPSRPRHAASTSGSASTPNKNRSRLLAIFDKENEASFDLNSILSTPVKGAAADGQGDTSSVVDDLDIDQVIDDRGHTALHWATALARISVVDQLLQRGADMHRGNFAGETPLIRAVLTTNNADGGTLGTLLADHLAPSLHTIDSSHRTVLHHIALIAGVKGRAASANSYMSTCLEYLSRTETEERMRAFVNVQDVHGDTALCVAARVGNKTLVKLLLEAGADKAKANDLGFRPVDFGLDVPVCTNTA
jgi:ankyrin repeat protein